MYIYLLNSSIVKKSLFGGLILVLIHLIPAYSQIETDPNLIVYYKFDGSAVDASANGFDATLVNSAAYVADRFGNPNAAFSFNGSSNYFLVENTSSIFKPTSFPVTVSAWVRIPSSFNGQFTIFKNDHQENIYSGIRATVIPSGVITIGIENGGPIGTQSRNTKTGNTDIMDDQWHLITCIVRGFNDMDIYIDCENDGGSYSGGATTLFYNSSNPGIFGAYDGFLGNSGLDYSEGDIDDLIFIGRELSFNEIVSMLGVTQVEITGNTFLCPGASTFITAQSGDSFLWSNGQTTQTIEITEPGTYSVQATNAGQCTTTAEVEISGAPIASWSPISMCESANVLDLNTLITGTIGGTWSGVGVNGNLFNPSGLAGNIPITYTVGSGNCIDSQTNNIDVNLVPEPPLVLADTSYCENSIPPTLVATVVPGATVEWIFSTNPNSVLSTTANLIPPQNLSGVFGVTQILNSCPSEYSLVNVDVIISPPTPVFLGNVVICSDELNEDIVIQSSGNPLWFDDAALSNQVNEGLVYEQGFLNDIISAFFVIVENDNCPSGVLEIPIIREDSLEAQILGNEIINACLPDEIILQSSDNTLNLWSTDETTQSISVNSAGIYTLTRSNSCNTVTDSVQINDVSVDASFDLFIPQEVYLPVSLELSNFEYGCDWYLQGEPLVLDENNSFVINEETSYSIEHHCENSFGCSDKETKIFTIQTPSEFYVPNAFTPNGDGDNDVFLPKGYKIESLYMLIFNRWGELVFQSNDVNTGWDGKTKTNIFAPDGLYTCLIEALDVYKNKYEYRGAVFLFK